MKTPRETPKKTKADPTEGWWISPLASWPDVSETTYNHWHRFSRSPVKLEPELAQTALAFGYGSRSAYGKYREWEDLEDQLKLDWRDAGYEREHPWQEVRSAVKGGWASAGDEVGGAEEPLASPSRSDLPLHLQNAQVPGGRVD